MAPTPVNSLNISQAGLVKFDGTSTFTAVTTTQYYTLVGSTGNGITNISPGSAGQILTSNGPSADPSYQSAAFNKLPWTDKATSFAIASNNGYTVSAVATATLPAAPAQGDLVAFIVDTASVLTITANTGQTIRVGSNVSATAGTLASNFQGDSVQLVYRSTDTSWIALGAPQGTWTLT